MLLLTATALCARTDQFLCPDVISMRARRSGRLTLHSRISFLPDLLSGRRGLPFFGARPLPARLGGCDISVGAAGRRRSILGIDDQAFTGLSFFAVSSASSKVLSSFIDALPFCVTPNDFHGGFGVSSPMALLPPMTSSVRVDVPITWSGWLASTRTHHVTSSSRF